MTINTIALIPPKVAPKMAAVLSLPDGASVLSCGAVPSVGVSGDVVGSVSGGCITTAPVYESRMLGHCY